MTLPTKEPTRLILHPMGDTDPRASLDQRSLVEASRNAFPIVAQTKPRKDSLGLAAGGAIAVLLGGLTFWSMSGHRAPAPRTVPAPAALPTPVAAPLSGRPLVAAPPSLMMPSVPSISPLAPPVHVAAPVMVYDMSSIPSAAVQTAQNPALVSPIAAPTRTARGSGEGNDNDQFASRVGDGDVQVASAQQLSNPSETVTQGTLIPAVLETAIDTDLPGYVRALVSQDVKSFDGTRVLIPRSSRLIGQYKSGLSAGQSRAYVIWTRLIRPDGVSVALASPGVDYAGNSGLAGKVNGHFLKRFGSAALLSVVSGLTAVGNASVVLAGGQSAASVAAQSDGNIPPTIRVPQGQPIRIFTARDLDFSTVAAIPAGQ